MLIKNSIVDDENNYANLGDMSNISHIYIGDNNVNNCSTIINVTVNKVFVYIFDYEEVKFDTPRKNTAIPTKHAEKQHDTITTAREQTNKQTTKKKKKKKKAANSENADLVNLVNMDAKSPQRKQQQTPPQAPLMIQLQTQDNFAEGTESEVSRTENDIEVCF